MIEVKIPAGVTVAVEGNKVTANGPKGSTAKDFKGTTLDLKLSGDTLSVSGNGKAIENTVRAHLGNMFVGVTKGFARKMIIRYAHFPISVEVKGKDIMIKNFLGERKPRKTKVHGNAKVEVKGQELLISGADREAVGQTVANIRKTTRIKDHDCRVFQDGIYPKED
jgi:large subunit ribosomal protein L6